MKQNSDNVKSFEVGQLKRFLRVKYDVPEKYLDEVVQLLMGDGASFEYLKTDDELIQYVIDKVLFKKKILSFKRKCR